MIFMASDMFNPYFGPPQPLFSSHSTTAAISYIVSWANIENEQLMIGRFPNHMRHIKSLRKLRSSDYTAFDHSSRRVFRIRFACSVFYVSDFQQLT